MNADDSRSPVAEHSAGERASEAFELLGNETRLEILLALWESIDPFDEEDAVRFSALRERVDTTDSSQFNYHLDKLVGHFVESTDDGYVLSRAGLEFVQAVIAGAGIDQPTIEPTDVDVPCTLCGEQVQISYEEGWVRVLCSACDGLWAERGDEPEGQLAKFSLPPAGLANRSAAEIYAAAWVRSFQDIYAMLEGVCPTCSGTIERSIDVCENHADEGVCPNCDRTTEVGVRVHCTVCKDSARLTPGVAAKYHPAVVAFFHDHGLDLQYGFNDLEHIERRLAIGESETTVRSRDPLRVRVTHHIDGDEIAVDLDENLSVVAIDDSSS